MNYAADKFAMLARSSVLCGLLGAYSSAHAFEFVSVAFPTILYDAPSLKAKKLFVATRYLPLEKVVKSRITGSRCGITPANYSG